MCGQAERNGYTNSLGLGPTAEAAEETVANSAEREVKQVDSNHSASGFPFLMWFLVCSKTPKVIKISHPHHGFASSD